MVKTTNRRSIGLDLSLTKTGVVVLEKDKILYKEIIKSTPTGDRPLDEVIRIAMIAGEVSKVVETYNPEVAVIENLAFLARGTSLTQLAGLSYMVRLDLVTRGIPFVLVAPTSLKKFVTGSGKCEKDHMILEAYKKFGVEGIDNNVADALFLAQIGSIFAGFSKTKLKYQEETIELLRKQK